QAVGRPIAEAGLDLLREIVQVRDHIVEPVRRQQAQDVVHDRAPQDGDHRLRDLVREWTQPRAEARGEHHRLQVPWSQLVRYFSCSAVSVSIATPIVSSFSLAIALSM